MYLHRVLVPEGVSVDQIGAALARERLGEPARFRAGLICQANGGAVRAASPPEKGLPARLAKG